MVWFFENWLSQTKSDPTILALKYSTRLTILLSAVFLGPKCAVLVLLLTSKIPRVKNKNQALLSLNTVSFKLQMNEAIIAIFNLKLMVEYASKTFLYMCVWNSILAFHLPCTPHKFFSSYSASTLLYSLAPSHHCPGLPCLTPRWPIYEPTSKLSIPWLSCSPFQHSPPRNHPRPIPACPHPLLWTTFALVKAGSSDVYLWIR